jgi:hypothetical protein
MRKCSIVGCENKHEAKGYCKKHYKAHMKRLAGIPIRVNHGLSRHPIYIKWLGMKARCYNPNEAGFCNYGGRGIYVCEEWKNSPLTFFDWALENGWRDGLEIDRIDNDGPYSPDNCRFATRHENNQNSRATKLTAEDVLSIRNLLKGGMSQSNIATLYGVFQTTISRIALRQTWKNI